MDDAASLGAFRGTMAHNGVVSPGQLGAPVLVPHAWPTWDDYPAISLMPRAEGHALERAKDLKCDDTAALLRAPSESPRASPPRI